MMQRTIFGLLLFSLLFLFVSAVPISARADHGTETEEPDADSTVELVDPGLTPASPLYVFDRLEKWARLNLLTFNPVKKAELRTRIAEERLAELRAISVTDGVSESLIERAEERMQTSAQDATRNIADLDGQGRDISAVVERLSELSLKQQQVLEGVLGRIPERARPAIQRALEVSHDGLATAREVVARQHDKGFINAARLEKFYEKNFDQLERQIEKRKEALERITDPDLREKAKEELERKIETLEDHALDVDIKPQLQEIKVRLEAKKNASLQHVLDVRQKIEFRDEAKEQLLRRAKEGDLNPVAEVKTLFEKVRARIILLEERMRIFREKHGDVPQDVQSLYKNAKAHLDRAQAQVGEENPRSALGNLTAAERNINSSFRLLENTDDRAIKKEVHPEVESRKPERQDSDDAATGERAENVQTTRDAAVPLQKRIRNILTPNDERGADKSEKTSQQPEQPAAAAPDQVAGAVSEKTIEIDDGSFRPKTLEIKKGTKVTWINRSGRESVWPASADHPTHDIYPEKGGCIGSAFDACRGLQSGEQYSFIFQEIGRWNYHDHLHVGRTGTIIVR